MDTKDKAPESNSAQIQESGIANRPINEPMAVVDGNLRSVSEARGSFRDVLKNRPFLLLWLAQLISQVGFNAANFGIIALTTVITGSTFMVGLAIISFTLPAVPFSAIAGVYVDYLNKRQVLWVCNALRAVATGLLVIGLLWNPHTVILLFALTFVISIITQFFTPAESTAIPLLVGEKGLIQALSLFNITLTLAQAIGFLVLGQLIAIFIPPFDLSLGFTILHVSPLYMLFVVVAIAYTICTFLILAIPASALEQERNKVWELSMLLAHGKQIWRTMGHDVKESWVFVYKDHDLFLALLQFTFVGILLLMIGELVGPFVQNVLHLPVKNIAIIFFPAAVGLFGSALFVPRLTRRLSNRRIIAVGSVGLAIGFILLPLGQLIFSHFGVPSFWLYFFVGAMSFIIGASLNMINIPASATLQQHTPEELRGRVFSLQSTLNNAGSIPVILFAGVIADTLGIENLMYLIAAGILGFQWWALHYSQSSPGRGRK